MPAPPESDGGAEGVAREAGLRDAPLPQVPLPEVPLHEWPLWEVFVRPRRGLSHTHSGSLHAPDAKLALQNARDLYTRRQEGVSIWVVRSTDITASTADQKNSFFDPAGDKVYRHPTFYEIPDGVEHL